MLIAYFVLENVRKSSKMFARSGHNKSQKCTQFKMKWFQFKTAFLKRDNHFLICTFYWRISNERPFCFENLFVFSWCSSWLAVQLRVQFNATYICKLWLILLISLQLNNWTGTGSSWPWSGSSTFTSSVFDFRASYFRASSENIFKFSLKLKKTLKRS